MARCRPAPCANGRSGRRRHRCRHVGAKQLFHLELRRTAAPQRFADQLNNDLTRLDSQLVTLQSAWWAGRLVTTLGLRRDEQEDFGSSVTLSPTRVVLGATRRGTPSSTNGRTRTFGAVFHLLPALGLYYNNANNFTPQGGVAWGVDFQQKNIPRGNRCGEGQDMGLKFDLFGGRIIGTLGYYETSEVNSDKSTLTRFNQTVEAIYTALRLPFVEVGGNDVTDFVSRGMELELTANLTPNWRLHLNGQRSKSAESNIAPWKTRFLEENLPIFRASASVPVAGNVNGNTVGQLAGTSRAGASMLRRLTDLPDWNPAVFLDTAEATLAVAVGYDWLYDSLTPADRDPLATALVEKGLRASFDSPAKLLWWVSGSNNWNQVCHGALVIGALAVADREPALAQRTVQRAIDELHSSAQAYAPDGIYPEGPMYWGYGTTFHVAMLAALETAVGDRCGLDRFPGFLVTADYLNQITAPSGDVFNYGDSRLSRKFEPALFWFARRLRQPSAIRWELDYLNRPASDDVSADAEPDADSRSRHLPLSLLWWDPALSALPVSATPPLHWKGDGAVPIAVHRSAWPDPRAVYVCLLYTSDAADE